METEDAHKTSEENIQEECRLQDRKDKKFGSD